MTVAIISHTNCGKHTMGEFHPESPARLAAIEQQLAASDLDTALQHIQANPIDPALLELAHDKDYIEFIFANAPATGSLQLDPDTSMNPFSLNAALLAAGAAVDAVDWVMQAKERAAFCLTRPPGHHAERDKAMGFCIFNNVAIAAAYAKQKYALDRVAIVDFDVHHGNGTENIFSDKQGYLFCSTFQHPFYPFSGTKPQPAHIVNSPLSPHANSEEFRQIIKRDWLPALDQFKPQLLIISAGFDAHIEDEMSQTRLVDQDYRWITDEIKKIADSYAEGRIVSVLEGGYSLNALGRCVVEHIKGLIG